MSSRAEINAALAKLKKLSPAGYFIGLHIRFAAPLMQFQTYNKDWAQRYSERAYALRDPTIAWGFSTTGACRWSVLPIPDPFSILQDAADHGLHYGLAVAFGPIKSRTIADFAHDKREFTDDEIEVISATVRRLHEVTEPPESLTKAQQEALRCIAEGDRHAAAAAKLGITESAFKARLISARERLDGAYDGRSAATGQGLPLAINGPSTVAVYTWGPPPPHPRRSRPPPPCRDHHTFVRQHAQSRRTFCQYIPRSEAKLYRSEEMALPEVDGMEFDQYDTPMSRWVAIHEHGRVLAGVRLTPTTARCGVYSYMIRDAQLRTCWAARFRKACWTLPAPVEETTWEASRLFHRSLDPQQPAPPCAVEPDHGNEQLGPGPWGQPADLSGQVDLAALADPAWRRGTGHGPGDLDRRRLFPVRVDQSCTQDALMADRANAGGFRVCLARRNMPPDGRSFRYGAPRRRPSANRDGTLGRPHPAGAAVRCRRTGQGAGTPTARLGAMLGAGSLSSLILWGPPGVGKTTIARLLARKPIWHFVQISGDLFGRAGTAQGLRRRPLRRQQGAARLLFVDEIHRFNKAQQDSFLPHMEDGTITSGRRHDRKPQL
jgi:LuxR family transcriptional regulator